MARKNSCLPAPLYFGDLPVLQINLALQLELEPGEAVMSGHAQRHASRRHGEDFSRALPHVASVIANPLYFGDDFRNKGKIEIVGRPPGWNEHLLVAVAIIRDASGRYNVTSIYPISAKKVEARRAKNHLVSAHVMKRHVMKGKGSLAC